MKGGAWPFLVGGLNCLVNSDNEQDLYLLVSNRWSIIKCIVYYIFDFGIPKFAS